MGWDPHLNEKWETEQQLLSASRFPPIVCHIFLTIMAQLCQNKSIFHYTTLSILSQKLGQYLTQNAKVQMKQSYLPRYHLTYII